MIIQCEKCRAKFNLDESLLKKAGSKVRCSLCKDIFMAFPPQEEELFPEGAATIAVSQDELEKTVTLEDEDTSAAEAAEKELEKELEATQTQAFNIDEFFGKTPKGKTKKAKRFPAKKSFFKSRLFILIIIILMLTGTAAGIFLWAPHLLPYSLQIFKPVEKTDITDIGIRRLEFKSVSGSFVDSDKAGHLFVIQGMVLNNYPKSRSFILIKGSVLDEKKNVIKLKMAFSGNPLTEEDIMTLPIEKINAAMKNRAGVDNTNINIASGTERPFTIVFENLSDDLSEFTVEAVSSSPGK